MRQLSFALGLVTSESTPRDRTRWAIIDDGLWAIRYMSGHQTDHIYIVQKEHSHKPPRKTGTRLGLAQECEERCRSIRKMYPRGVDVAVEMTGAKNVIHEANSAEEWRFVWKVRDGRVCSKIGLRSSKIASCIRKIDWECLKVILGPWFEDKAIFWRLFFLS